MSKETNMLTVFSYLPPDCPDRLKKIIKDCVCSNETLDNLLKLLGDVSYESHLVNIILDLVPIICSDSTIQLSELEFAILSLQNIYNMNLLKTDMKCKLLEVIVTVLLTYQPSQEVVVDVVQFLLNVLENKSEPISTCLTSMDCLIEIEMSTQGILGTQIENFFDFLNHDHLRDKASEITSLIIRNATNSIPNQSRVLCDLLELMPSLGPFTMVTVAKNILGICRVGFQTELNNSLEKLLERYKTTFDLCVLQTITSIQECLGGITDETAVFLYCTHPAMPVGRNLISLDWLASSLHLKKSRFEIRQFEPNDFDGADARLKKLLLMNKALYNQSLDPTLFYQHFENLIAFAIKNGTSRALASVFRVMRDMLESNFPTNAAQIVLHSTVALGARHPACLPHIIDFLKHFGANQPGQLPDAITLGLVDAFDDMEISIVMPHMEHLIQFFMEATLYRYEFCQPRMILRIIRNCLEEKKNSNCGIAVLELCQALIRNQDYEIFQPELKTVLSLVETSHSESDVKQRAWMLRSLITHVNTDSLKDAFDADMDLSSTGKIEKTDYPLIFVKILFDYNKIGDTRPVYWSLDRKRSFRSFYFPLEISLIKNAENLHPEFVGLKIDFIVDPKWGRAEPIYIPVLEVDQVRKACLQVHPLVCSAATIEARVVMSTTDGRIFLSGLEPIQLKLEDFLNPLSSSKSFVELWDRIVSQSEKCYSSALFLPQPQKLLKAVEYGELDKFQMAEKPTELAMVTPDSFLVLVRILSVKNSWHAEILVEDPSVLPVIYSLLTEFST
ncbi:uncharacterized protein LOC130691362 isoform X2 [Daphnia carinata]|uniref:uncharacterized protein LOC130691362 isoform X2 n=1 Tax=Daphnia carinata TaxID=120202 RepID=UPI0028688CAB|nr:uncharacterized protein LOC130691362 isoform X2 [Daphnia carinata]